MGAAEARALFRGIPQRENVLGAADAPVTLVEYADLQCPYCRDFELQWMPSLVARYVHSGKAKVVFRPLAFIGADSVRGRNAVIAAGLQGRLFETVQMFYASQGAENAGWLDDGLVKSVVAAIPRSRPPDSSSQRPRLPLRDARRRSTTLRSRTAYGRHRRYSLARAASSCIESSSGIGAAIEAAAG